jgi:hypothetical protein
VFSYFEEDEKGPIVAKTYDEDILWIFMVFHTSQDRMHSEYQGNPECVCFVSVYDIILTTGCSPTVIKRGTVNNFLIS